MALLHKRPNFAPMQYFFFIASFNAFFFAILSLQKKTKAIHDWILVAWLLYLGFFIGTYAFFSHEYFVEYPFASSRFISLFLMHGPFLYLYVKYLVSGTTGIFRNDFLHLLPILLFNLYLLIAWFIPDVQNRISLDHVVRDIHPPIIFTLFLILTVLSGPVYFILSVRLLNKHHGSVFRNFSSSSDVDLNWLQTLVYIFGIIWTTLMVITSIHHVFHFFTLEFCTDGLFLSLSVFVILVGYFGLKQQVIFTPVAQEHTGYIIEEQTKYSGSGLTRDESALYLEKLNNHMVKSRPFLDPKLSLPQLASELGISSHHLSQIINENHQLNFFDFINRYRVEEVKKRMGKDENNHLSLLGIAFESGFNSKSAFNRMFKKFTGKTPSQFKNSTA
jgi:AraC-like DNA-binding protein